MYCSERLLLHELLKDRFDFHWLRSVLIVIVQGLVGLCLRDHYSLLAHHFLNRRLGILYLLCFILSSILWRLSYDLDIIDLDIKCSYASFVRA